MTASSLSTIITASAVNMTACPNNARYYTEATGAVDKNTFCMQRIHRGRQAACVETGPTKVPVFVDLNDRSSEVLRPLVTSLQVEKPEIGTDPFLFYII